MPQKILIVDDDPSVVNTVAKTLRRNGFATVTAETTARARSILVSEPIDLVLLDINLPDGDGVDFTRSVRKTMDTPIIFVSGRTDVYDTIIGLEIGGDDFVKKPFEPRELVARVSTVLRRYKPRESPVAAATTSGQTAVLDQVRIDFSRFEAYALANDAPCGLTGAEFGILKVLCTTKLEAVSREILLHEIFGGSSTTSGRSVDSHIVRLRKKLTEAGCRPDLIKTVYRVGYKVTEPVRFEAAD